MYLICMKHTHMDERVSVGTYAKLSKCMALSIFNEADMHRIWMHSHGEYSSIRIEFLHYFFRSFVRSSCNVNFELHETAMLQQHINDSDHHFSGDNSIMWCLIEREKECWCTYSVHECTQHSIHIHSSSSFFEPNISTQTNLK